MSGLAAVNGGAGQAVARLAVTGATGFVGSRLLDRALAAGHTVDALTRRAQPDRAGVRWVDGALDRPASLDRLMEAADGVIHLAGAVTARDAAGFRAANVAGTHAVLAAAARAGVRRFVHVSSLAAREPELSDYGRSKAYGEREVRQSGQDWTVVRPPAVYGPGDTEMLDVFRMATRGVVLMPPRGRASVLHADDLSDLLLALIHRRIGVGSLLEPDDGERGGWSHASLATAIGWAVGRRVAVVHAPARALALAARADRFVRRGRAKLTPDRAAYLSHRDWVSDPAAAIPRGLVAAGDPDAARVEGDGALVPRARLAGVTARLAIGSTSP